MLSACGKANTTSETSITIAEHEKQINVKAGGEFKIIIEANPTTGYHWEIVGALDESMMQFVSRDYRASEPALIGSGGNDVWVFKALAAGTSTITLGYYPPSNDPVEPEQTIEITIVAE
jgi:inhibitor of cysteine peptidase